MLAALKDWRVIAGTGLLLWAAGLQVMIVSFIYAASAYRTSQARKQGFSVVKFESVQSVLAGTHEVAAETA